MQPRAKRRLFFTATCVDCNRNLLQSFHEDDIDKMALLHGQLCNHETYTTCDGMREQER